MAFSGKHLIAGNWLETDNNNPFSPWCPAQHCASEHVFFNASLEQVNAAAEAASRAFPEYRNTSLNDRAAFLNNIADQILLLGDELLDVTQQETGYNLVRIVGERGRTVNQLRAFAKEIAATAESPTRRDIVEAGDITREPLPKPATRLTRVPLGPVVVFGASNFPYAFSTLGGDTASALAAGCPVIVKAHPAHPGTCELMARAIEAAIQKTGMPPGVFAQLQSNQPAISHALVKHPLIKAVGFTGSQKVGDLLQQSIYQREEPIPFYGELGSTNPQFVLPQKAQQDGAVLAEQLCQSMLMGNGQFCTSPGVWIVPEEASNFLNACKAFIANQGSDVLLTPGILNEYQSSVALLAQNEQLSLFATGKQEQHFHAQASLFLTRAENYMNNAQLRREIFGPCAIIVTYNNTQSLLDIVDVLEGQLTASIHGSAEGDNSDIAANHSLIDALSYKVGRLIYNQMPTGVEVCTSMNHGGPYPACTDIRSTSVGMQAIARFERPLCVQNEVFRASHNK